MLRFAGASGGVDLIDRQVDGFPFERSGFLGGIGRPGRSLADDILRAFSNAMRENPLPSLLIGAGCMMFLSEKMGLRPGGLGNGGRPMMATPDDPYGYGVSGGTSPVAELAGRVRGSAASSARSAAATIQSSLSGAAEAAQRQASNVAGAVADRMTQTAGTVGDTMRQTAATVGDTIEGAADAVRATTHDLRDQASGAVEQMRRGAQNAAGPMRDTAASMGGRLATPRTEPAVRRRRRSGTAGTARPRSSPSSRSSAQRSGSRSALRSPAYCPRPMRKTNGWARRATR